MDISSIQPINQNLIKVPKVVKIKLWVPVKFFLHRKAKIFKWKKKINFVPLLLQE